MSGIEWLSRVPLSIKEAKNLVSESEKRKASDLEKLSKKIEKEKERRKIGKNLSSYGYFEIRFN